MRVCGAVWVQALSGESLTSNDPLPLSHLARRAAGGGGGGNKLNETLTPPCIVYLCQKCDKQARFTEFDYAPIDDDECKDEWLYLRPEVLTQCLADRGWIIDDEGHTYCSGECQSKSEIDNEYSTQRAMSRLRLQFPNVFKR